jgi:hypothetical protein
MTSNPSDSGVIELTSDSEEEDNTNSEENESEIDDIQWARQDMILHHGVSCTNFWCMRLVHGEINPLPIVHSRLM